jgi:hypothetical protein
MGCDIHLNVEILSHSSSVKEWKVAISEEATFSDRNYFLFGVLAGVRGSAKPISLPRGIPEDSLLKKEEENPDNHSASYLLFSELKNYDWDQTFEQKTLLTITEYMDFKSSLKGDTKLLNQWHPHYIRKSLTENEFLQNFNIPKTPNGELVFDEKIKTLAKLDDARLLIDRINIVVTWQEPYRDFCYSFLEWLNFCRKYGRLSLYSDDEIRLVFWFDN